MAFTNYYTVNGQLVGESTGGIWTGYLLDGLGSVTARTDAAGTIIDQSRYEAFGTRHQVSGLATILRFGWCGSWGYRASLVAVAIYVRARQYDARMFFWTSRDPLWPNEPAYEYVRSNPNGFVDPFGLVDISNQACSSVQIRVLPQLTFGMEYCNWCYKCNSCDPGPWASRCWSLAGNATWTLVGVQFDNILEDARKTIESILRILVGATFAANQCLHPESACLKPSKSGDFEICLRACGVIVSASCCAGVKVDYNGGQHFDISCGLSYGYCGLPSITLRLRVRTKQCD